MLIHSRSTSFLLFVACSGLFGQKGGIAPDDRPRLALARTDYALQPGATVELEGPEATLGLLSKAAKRSATGDGNDNWVTVGPDISGTRFLVAASLLAPPGEYTVLVSGLDDQGQERSTEIKVSVAPLPRVAANAIRAPVVLLNGWQLGLASSCPLSTSFDTFGTLESALLADGVPQVYYFDNCREGKNLKIEDLGDRLRAFLELIRSTNESPILQIDLVGHSVGGLIVRSYLAGLRSDGSLVPPNSIPVGKFVQVATPNFGSFKAVSGLGPQTSELIPGSDFLWRLATWNQGQDDLRGVDSLAIVGNKGYKGFLSSIPALASDGVVSLTSASLTFSRDSSRTRILPLCHKDTSFVDVVVGMDCDGSSIAKASTTHNIIRSFLGNRSDWQTIGTTPPTDPYLSRYGGMFFADQTARGQWLEDLSQVSFGSVPLSLGGGSLSVGRIFYNEFVTGTGSFGMTSRSQGTMSCGSATQPAGVYKAWRCKSSPLISFVTPLHSGPALVVQSGRNITLNGIGFGQPCSACRVVMLAGLVSLQVVSWTDQAVTVFLPASSSGVTTLFLENPNGSDLITFMAAPLPNYALSTTNIVMTYAIGSAPPSQSVAITNTGGGVLTWTATSNSAWLVATSASGTAPSTLGVSVNPVGLTPGAYAGAITVASVGLASRQINVSLTVTAPPIGPTITSVLNGASFLPGIQSNSWITITGTNLASTSRIWNAAQDIVNNVLPTSLDGVRVSINGKAAVVYFISPTQINVLAPSDSTTGPVQVTVTNSNSTSVAFTAQLQRYSPAFFAFDVLGGRYPAAVNGEGSYLGPAGLFGSALQTKPAGSGSVILLFGTGFGPTNPSVPADRVFAGATSLADPVTVTIGDLAAQVVFSGIVSNGLYQFNVVVPNLPNGEFEVLATIGGMRTQPNVFVAVGN
jgi:uncharacterized protein (TIGR03437 family)